MARIREALRRADTVRGQPRETVPAPRPYQPEDVRFSAETEEEVPFIEVGGRETPMEASPSVLGSVPNKRGAPSAEREAPEQGSALCVPRFALCAERSPAAAVRLTGVAFRSFPPELAPLPPVLERFAPDLVALHQPDHPISEQYRALVKNLEKQLPARQSQALLFTSPTPQTDTTPVLLNLAITRARRHATATVVVDANLRRPAVAERLGLPAAPGLGDVLAGRLSLPRAIQETGLGNLYALTAGKIAHENTTLVAGDAMRVALRDLRGRFDWIFVNAPCWDGRPEASTLRSACDAVYVVVPETDVDTSAVEELSQLIVEQGGCLQGYFLVSSV
jgi:hypothetical protein